MTVGAAALNMGCDDRSGNLGARRPLLLIVWAFCLLLPMAACHQPINPPASPIILSAHPWPAADALFHQDPRWLGADDAHSVELSAGRILWLFGDTFVDVHGSAKRSAANLIRNSIGVQSGSDPSRAAMRFFWRQSDEGSPAAFFDPSGNAWLWPGDGIRLGSQLLIFLMRMEPSDNALGFSATGWTTRRVVNPDSAPDVWRMETARHPRRPMPITLGSGGVLLHGGYLYAYGADSGGSRAFVARWPEMAAADGDLRDPHWWAGKEAGWTPESERTGWPAALFTDAQTEFGVHFEPRMQQFIQVQSIGFGSNGLGYRSAFRPQGPWGRLTRFYLPPDASTPGILIYAAKSHPFLNGVDLVVTYATNHFDASRVWVDDAIYYPRFVRVDIHP